METANLEVFSSAKAVLLPGSGTKMGSTRFTSGVTTGAIFGQPLGEDDKGINVDKSKLLGTDKCRVGRM